MNVNSFLLAFGGLGFGAIVVHLFHALSPQGLRAALANQQKSTSRAMHALLQRLEEMTGQLAEAKRLRCASLDLRLRPESLSKLGALLAFADPDEFLRGHVAAWDIYEQSFSETLSSLKRMASGNKELDAAILLFTQQMTVDALIDTIVTASA